MTPNAYPLTVEPFTTTTTNATQTTVYEQEIAANYSTTYEVEATAFCEGHDEAKTWTFSISTARFGTDAPVVMGSVLNILTPRNTPILVLWDIAADLNGNNLRIRVTGAASRTIHWAFRISGFGLYLS